MPDERAGDPGNGGSTTADRAGAPGPGSVDGRHLLLVGAGPGLGMAVARRFAVGGYRVTLVARSTGGLRGLAGTLAATGATISTIAADASDPEGLGARIRELYLGHGAPGVIVYNAVMGAPDRLLSSTAAHLQAAYAVDVIGAIAVAQAAAPAMRAASRRYVLRPRAHRRTLLAGRPRGRPMAGRIPVHRRVGGVSRMRGKPGTELQYHDDAAALADPPPQTGHYLTAGLHQ